MTTPNPEIPADLNAAAEAILAAEVTTPEAPTEDAEVQAIAERAVKNPPTDVKAEDKPADKVETKVEAEAVEDPVAKARIERINQREQERLTRIKAAETAFDTKRAEWEPKITKAQQDEARWSQALSDPLAMVALLEERGVKDLNALAEAAYLKSAGTSAPEGFKAKVEQRAISARLEKLEQENKTLRETEQKRALQVQAAAVMADYETKVTAAATAGDDPLVKAYMAKKPEIAKREMLNIAEQIAAEHPGIPDPLEVLERFGANLREVLPEESQHVLLKPTTTNPKQADTTTAAPTLTNKVSQSPTKPRGAPQSSAEELAEGVKFWEETQRARAGG